jgi:hypothetical protein
MADITSRQFDLSRVKENLKLFKVFAVFASNSISRVTFQPTWQFRDVFQILGGGNLTADIKVASNST